MIGVMYIIVHCKVYMIDLGIYFLEKVFGHIKLLKKIFPKNIYFYQL